MRIPLQGFLGRQTLPRGIWLPKAAIEFSAPRPPTPWVSPVPAMVRGFLGWKVGRKKRLHPRRHIWIIRLLSFGEIT